jgi:NAD(P)-dependent dehydrogenase (short-subunit alcohol dehydrogenase family)
MNTIISDHFCFTEIPESKKEELLKSKISLKRFGSTQDIANAAMFIAQADYMHGQVSKNVKSTVTSATLP